MLWVHPGSLINVAGRGSVVEAILLLGRLLLAGVFLVASLSKLADRAQFRQTLVDFGIPVFLSNPLSLLLPFAELAIAGALIPTAMELARRRNA